MVQARCSRAGPSRLSLERARLQAPAPAIRTKSRTIRTSSNRKTKHGAADPGRAFILPPRPCGATVKSLDSSRYLAELRTEDEFDRVSSAGVRRTWLPRCRHSFARELRWGCSA